MQVLYLNMLFKSSIKVTSIAITINPSKLKSIFEVHVYI